MVVLLILIIFAAPARGGDYAYLKNLSTLATVDGKSEFIKCPEWDWSLIPAECKSRYMISLNCLPRCGKYPGDKPDIGGYEYFPGITSERPWGDWNGIPLQYKPGGVASPKNFRVKKETGG